MLDQCIGWNACYQWTVSLMVVKDLPDQYQNCNTGIFLILGGYHKMRESLYTGVIIWVVPS